MIKEKDSKKPLKNYVILIIIFVVSCAFTLYLCEWYNVYDDYKKQTPVIRGTLSEIGYNDLDHYVVDISNVIIYTCTASDDKCRSFEKNFKKYIKKNNLNDDIVYLNVSDVDQEQFINEFNEKYNYKIKLTNNYPAFISFKDGKVESILQNNKKKNLTMSKVEDFLEMNMYKEED